MTRIVTSLLVCLSGLLVACDIDQPLAAVARPGASSALHFRGVCDASAVAPLAGDLFVVAGDEDNTLRIYSATRPGLPLRSLDLSAFLRVDPKSPEVDLEGAARSGDLIFWISSHGRNASGKERLSRHRLFATKVEGSGQAVRLEPTGVPYTELLQDLINDARLASFRLSEAAARPPKSPGGLNIEGLAFTPEGHLLVGFRNPVPQGKALLVRLMNPLEIVNGKRAQIGPPTLLDLGGLGIRSFEGLDDGYLIIAGGFDGSGTSTAYHWKGGAAAPELIFNTELLEINPEAAAILGSGQLLVLSDDGTQKIGGRDCKKLKDLTQRMYRALVLEWPPGHMLGQVKGQP